ncbi:MAG: hypothetical protein KAI53_00545 [Candidatus Aenigmarchaeota archaeon]|nr:hypothetical protein [Candidatus Aenigmarchaeota archaeon]
MTEKNKTFEYNGENKTDEYVDIIGFNETGNRNSENNQSFDFFDFKQDKNEKISAKTKIQLGYVLEYIKTIVIQPITNSIRLFGIERFFWM